MAYVIDLADKRFEIPTVAANPTDGSAAPSHAVISACAANETLSSSFAFHSEIAACNF